jgi:glycerol kinase
LLIVKYVLALDQGTTSSRAILFGPEGRIRARAQAEFAQHFPRDGWVEHAPAELWQTQLRTARAALEQAGATANDLAAVGIANQRETTLIWDRATGAPIHRAVVWQDRRTADLCGRLTSDGLEPLFREKTGLVLDPYFAGTKIRWLLDHVDGAQKRAEAGALCFGTVDTWLIWKLTGGADSGGDPLHVTDATNASRTLLYDIHEGRWDDELLDALNVPRALLPEVRSSSEVYGRTAPDVFGAPVPIASAAGDQQAALFGQRCTRAGMAKSTYGTGAFVLMHTGTDAVASENRLLTTVALERAGRTTYALEGSIFAAGAVVQWLRDGLGLIDEAAEVEALARSVESSGGVYLVPAFTGLGAPHWDPRARGAVLGLTRAASAGHLARAALDAIAHQVADALDAMEDDAAIRTAELRADGGAAANDLLLQTQADLAGVPVRRPHITETTALGAAYLAGLAVSFWESEADIDAHHGQAERPFPPAMGDARADEQRDGWRRALDRAKAWA